MHRAAHSEKIIDRYSNTTYFGRVTDAHDHLESDRNNHRTVSQLTTLTTTNCSIPYNYDPSDMKSHTHHLPPIRRTSEITFIITITLIDNHMNAISPQTISRPSTKFPMNFISIEPIVIPDGDSPVPRCRSITKRLP